MGLTDQYGRSGWKKAAIEPFKLFQLHPNRRELLACANGARVYSL